MPRSSCSGKSRAASGPVKGRGGGQGGDGVVAVEVYAAFAAKGEHYLRAPLADALDQHRDQLGGVVSGKLAVGEMEDFAASDPEDLSGGGKLGAPQLGQFIAARRIAAVGGRLALGEADDRGLDAGRMGHEQRSAKCAALVVGVRR